MKINRSIDSSLDSIRNYVVFIRDINRLGHFLPISASLIRRIDVLSRLFLFFFKEVHTLEYDDMDNLLDEQANE